LARVNLSVGMTEITNGDIENERDLRKLGGLGISWLQSLADPAKDDRVAVYDESTGEELRITLESLLKVVDDLTEGTALDGAADWALIYDDSAGAVVKVKLSSLVEPTGKAAPFVQATAPPGWVAANGGTIGNASSGGTTRANADTEALFTAIWTDTADAEAPVLPGGRGASAAADFAANKTIPVPNIAGRTVIGAGSGSGLTTRANMATGGEEAHLLTEAELASHPHGFSVRGDYVPGQTYPGMGHNASGNIGTATTNEAGGDEAHNTMQPWVALHWHIKL